MAQSLKITVIAPDDQLAAEGESYAELTRPIELPISPFIGLKVGLSATISDEAQKQRFERLSRAVVNPSPIFEICDVFFFEKNEWLEARTILQIRPACETTITSWKAYLELLCDFYGFERLY